MRWLLMVLGSSVLLTSCVTATPNAWTAIQPTVETPQLIAVPRHNQADLKTGMDPSIEQAFQRYVKTGQALNIETAGFIQFAYNANQQPIVQTTPLQETVISLEPNEHFTNISSGDPNRWSYAVAVSGQGESVQQNILIKPAMLDIATNMVITTDKRLYNIRLVSSNNQVSTKVVRFWYPDALVASFNQTNTQAFEEQPIAQMPQVNLKQMNFAYRMKVPFGHRVSWKPLRVFDDGVHTYIQMPETVSSHDLPVLFIADDHVLALVNVRYKVPYMIVDKVFKKAQLVSGVGHFQTKMTLINQAYR